MKKSKDWESQVQNQVYHLHNNGQENWPLGFYLIDKKGSNYLQPLSHGINEIMLAYQLNVGS